jgi:hypothetical protein
MSQPGPGKSSGPYKGRLVDPALRRIRYLNFVHDKLAGKTDQQIADKWNLDYKTVVRTLTWGKRNNIIADAEDELLQDLFPEAKRVVKAALAENDIQVAMKLYTMVVKGRDAKPGSGAAVDEDELAIYMAKRRKAQQELENTTEGELVAADEPLIGGLLGDGADGAADATGADGGDARESVAAAALSFLDHLRNEVSRPAAVAEPSTAPRAADSEARPSEPRDT